MTARTLSGPWSFRDGLLVLLTFALVYTALSIGHLYGVKYWIGIKAYLGNGPRLPPHLLIVNQLLKALSLVAVVWFVALKRKGLSWREVGFVPCHAKWLLLAVAVALLGFVFRLWLAKQLVFALPDWARFVQSPFGWNDGSLPVMLLLIGMTVFITPVAEELFFRGFLFRWMASHHRLWLAMLASSMMFGASHLVPAQIISAALMSILIILLYLGSRSLWPCILCHVLNNAIGMALSMAAVAGKLPAVLMPPAVS